MDHKLCICNLHVHCFGDVKKFELNQMSCHRMFLTPTSWNYLHICHAFMLHCCCLKHLTWSTIKPHLIKGKLHKIQKVLLALTLLLWLLQILFLSRRQLDSLFSCLRHLEFHFRFEKKTLHFWRVIKQCETIKIKKQGLLTLVSHGNTILSRNKSNKTSQEWHIGRSPAFLTSDDLIKLWEQNSDLLSNQPFCSNILMISSEHKISWWSV